MSKIKLYPYNKDFIEIFEKEKMKIKKVLPEAEIHHIGSTAIPGVAGKGIIDILIALDNWEEKEKTVEILKGLGFTHIHPEEEGRIFLSRIGDTKYKDAHIHLVEKGNKDYRKKLLFRDFLREDQIEAQKYQELKYRCIQEAKGNRNKYNELKDSYIEKILKRAQEKY